MDMAGEYGRLASQSPEVAKSTPAALNAHFASRSGSLPTITISGDHNSNTILNVADKRASSLKTFPLTPRREGRIKLPARYQQKLESHQQKLGLKAQSETTLPVHPGPGAVHPGSRSLGCLSENEVSKYGSDVTGSSSTSDRLSDLDTALKWIKQEMLQIKQEDRFLMRRLLDLRARLHQLQGLPSHFSLSSNLALLGSCGSDLDIATWTSFLSLDEGALGREPTAESPTALREVIQGFQDHLQSYGPALSGLSRSASSREAFRPPPTKIRRKKSLPMASELEEDHFFDDDE